jgi:hypothetical protein
VVLEELEVEAAFGLVTTPMARPPTAPARIPIRARTRALSTKLDFPRFDIDFSPRFAARDAVVSLTCRVNWVVSEKCE